MRMPKVNWLTIGSFVAMAVGFIFDEVQREVDNEETKQELKTYVDKRMAGIDPDSED